MIFEFYNIVSQHILIYCIIILQLNKHKDVYGLVLFDGARHVQNAGKILQARHPRITVYHGDEHVVSLFFSDVFLKIPAFNNFYNFSKKLRNLFGSTRHTTTAMFNKYSNKHNNGIKVGFVKPSD